MKKFFALSLLSAAALMADSGADALFNDEASLLADNVKKNQQTQTQRPAYNPPNDCCKPCCIPQPKKCIDCECYTPAFYESNGCDAGVFLTADFLYWYARETNLSYAAMEKATSYNPGTILGGVAFEFQNVKHLETKWKPGFRAGIGVQTECDGWDFYLDYTWYRNQAKNRTTVPSTFGSSGAPFLPTLGQEALLNPWSSLLVVPGTLPAGPARLALFNSITAKWHFTLNDIDFELGRHLWLSKCFAIRPYAALRGAWVRRDFTTLSVRDNAPLANMMLRFKDRFKDRYWGVGMEVGLQPEWYFANRFAVISNFDAALLWGRFRDHKNQDYFSTVLVPAINYHTTTKNNFSKMQSIFDLMIGFRWDETWACNRFRTALDIGWEHHIWLNFINMIKQTSQVIISTSATSITTQPINYIENQGDLIFGGLTVRFRFDF